MTWPNVITLGRLLLTPVVVLLLLRGDAAAANGALALVLLGGFSDWLDGTLARRLGQTSRAGKFLDALVDKVWALGLFAVFVSLRELPAVVGWLLVVILLRDLAVTLLRWRVPSPSLDPDTAGKAKTALQMAALAALAWSHAGLALGPSVRLAGTVLFFASALLSLVSGARYFWAVARKRRAST